MRAIPRKVAVAGEHFGLGISIAGCRGDNVTVFEGSAGCSFTVPIAVPRGTKSDAAPASSCCADKELVAEIMDCAGAGGLQAQPHMVWAPAALGLWPPPLSPDMENRR